MYCKIHVFLASHVGCYVVESCFDFFLLLFFLAPLAETNCQLTIAVGSAGPSLPVHDGRVVLGQNICQIKSFLLFLVILMS